MSQNPGNINNNGNFNQLPSLPRLSQGFGSMPGQVNGQQPMNLPGNPMGQQPHHQPPQLMSGGPHGHRQLPHVNQNMPHHAFLGNAHGMQPGQPQPHNMGHGGMAPDQRARIFAPPPVQYNPPPPPVVPSNPVQENPAAPNGNYRPLNVRDALTYLDDVKEQFKNEPMVYHKFLDVMKEFKMNEISTPGVIERVSTLFRGHPNLIVGFNTFLPPGFRIEINNDQAGSYTITTPETSMQINHFYAPNAGPPNVNPPNFSGAPSHMQHIPQHGAMPPQMNVPEHQFNAPNQAGPGGPFPSHGVPPPQQPQPPQQQQPGPPPLQQQQNSQAAQRRTPVEFNHAINYVNKIKNRYANDPETYRQFLEILRTYQNESKPIPEVYSQIQVLFKDAPDLLDEFKQFLPDTSANNAQAGQQQPNASFAPYQPIPVKGQPPMSGRPPQMGRFRRQPGGNRIRFDQQMRIYAGEEFEFFERVKKCLANKTTYSEFLKVLNLFNQDIIDPKLLIEKVEPFLSKNPELFEWFKNYVKYEEKEEPNEIVRAETPPRDLSDAKRSGSSYRLLPPDYTQATCSGRDPLCESVLNDKWVCHPTWASEDGGFIAHKKNQFEEALYRCEEERYEFDLNIEANKCVIQRLEPIARKIAEMTPEEQASFKLPDGLGDGMSKSIYKRIIKKIYDKDRGEEVIEAVHEHPAVAIPIVLKRLKQKDEEWRRSQREWNKVWREIDAKNFYKSLDHQGLNFKTSDKKSLMSKSLIMEIETLYRERHEKPNPSKPKHHLMLKIGEFSIQKDIHRLMLSYLDKASQFSSEDIGRVSEFMKKLLDAMNIVKKSQWHTADGNIQNKDNEDSMQVDEPEEKVVIFFGNSSYYLFFRLYELAYSRLKSLKKCSDDMKSVAVGYSRSKQQKLPESLDLVAKRDPVPVEVKNEDIYASTLDMIEKFFENELEPSVFEEQMRFWFGTTSYIMYTVDKLFHSLCKQMVNIVSDARCTKLFSLFQKYSRNISESTLNFSQYRQKADEIVEEEENMYRIEYNRNEKTVTIELLGDDEGQADDVGINELKWTEYIENYVKLPVSGNMNLLLKNPIFLKRTCKKPEKEVPHEAINNLECKICINTYKMFFVENSEDFYRRLVPRKSKEILQSTAEKRKLKFEKEWLNNSEKGWAKSLSEHERKDHLEKCNEFFLHGKIAGQSTSSHHKFKTAKGKLNNLVKYTTIYSNTATSPGK